MDFAELKSCLCTDVYWLAVIVFNYGELVDILNMRVAKAFQVTKL